MAWREDVEEKFAALEARCADLEQALGLLLDEKSKAKEPKTKKADKAKEPE
jgi:hypothetical protein